MNRYLGLRTGHLDWHSWSCLIQAQCITDPVLFGWCFSEEKEKRKERWVENKKGKGKRKERSGKGRASVVFLVNLMQHTWHHPTEWEGWYQSDGLKWRGWSTPAVHLHDHQGYTAGVREGGRRTKYTGELWWKYQLSTHPLYLHLTLPTSTYVFSTRWPLKFDVMSSWNMSNTLSLHPSPPVSAVLSAG